VTGIVRQLPERVKVKGAPAAVAVTAIAIEPLSGQVAGDAIAVANKPVPLVLHCAKMLFNESKQIKKSIILLM
jgi:hypothetical protein